MSEDAAEYNTQPDREKWLEKRQAGIGGSDAAAVMGVSPWKSPLALWAEKTGLVEQPNLEELEYIEWGQVLEEPIAKKYRQVTGRSLSDMGRYAILTSDLHPFMHTTIDRIIDLDASKPGLVPVPAYAIGLGDLSVKNVGFFQYGEWEEEPPLQYQIQLQHELVVTGLCWGSYAVLIGGQRFRWMDQPRNDKFISYLVEKEEEFWDMVQRGIQPAADASDSTREILLRLYPKDTGASIVLPEELQEARDKRQELKAQIKRAEEELQGFDNQIKAAIGNATIGLFPDGTGYSWKHQDRDPYTVSASDFRVLREIKEGKGKK
jgi:putative phage-type endonuclease